MFYHHPGNQIIAQVQEYLVPDPFLHLRPVHLFHSPEFTNIYIDSVVFFDKVS